MSVTADTVVVGVPAQDISLDLFRDVLKNANSPAAATAGAAYIALSQFPVSIAFCLAIFHHESQYATDPNAIVLKYDTKNPGNCRTVRWRPHPTVDTPRGEFVKYPDWPAGWSDLSFRLVDLLYVYAKEGRTTIRQIIERFAPATDNNVPESYINAVVADMNRWIGTSQMTAEIPGFAWQSADARHHTPGRTEAIRGGAQHYSAGVNSLDYLTVNPNSNVSATFLVRHNPTLTDRGWQLVKIEDTPHTTGEIVNPFTVSIEYEHTVDQTIPDIAYEVLAQTWADADAYVRTHGLGQIDEIKGHKQWVGDNRVCPDGIDVERIVRRFHELVAPAEPEALIIPNNPHGDIPIVLGFRSWCITQGNARDGLDLNRGIVAVCGFPTELEWAGVDGRTFQRFERLTLVYNPALGVPFDVTPKLLDEALPERKTT